MEERQIIIAGALALAACTAGDPEVASEGLYTRDNPGRNLTPQHEVEDYQPLRELRVDEHGDRHIVVRSLSHDGEPSHLVIHDATLRTAVVAGRDLDASTRVASEAEADGFRYPSLLEQTRSGVLCHLDDGHAASPGTQLTVTIDLCQSRREWDAALFERLVELSDVRGEPTRVGIALTGLWAQRHTTKLAQLIQWRDEGKLDITWINHSYHHQLSKDGSGHYHFLTAESVDLEAGVLDLEQLLIEQGERPSVLFRFPGLTHDARTLGELNDLSLFPMDANGWVAKGEPLDDGSVVLLHGNGNEPPGVRMFLEWADAHWDELASGDVTLSSPLAALPSDSAHVQACSP